MEAQTQTKLSFTFTRLGLILALLMGVLGMMMATTTWAQPGNPDPEPDPNTHTAPLTTTVSVTYDEPISATTVTSRTFAVLGMQSGLVTETHSVINGNTIIVTPTSAFHQGELVYAIATTQITNITGTPLLSATQWQFRAGQVTTRCVGGFARVGTGLAGVHSSSAAWGDYDNDGDLDILLTGYSDSGTVSLVYRNDGPAAGSGWTFTDIGAGLPGVQDGWAAWGDYDNDGDLDVLLAGQSNIGPLSLVYRNDGPAAGSGWTFTDIGAGLLGIMWGSVAWGDYDNDGDLDILLMGFNDAVRRVSRVYRNDAGSFTDIGAELVGARWGSAAWGDYDNDGDLDILLAGYTGDGKDSSLIYRNDGPAAGSGWTFTDIGAGLPGLEASRVAWGDYDNDGDLDILLTGWDQNDNVSLLYRNDGPAAGSGWTFTDIGAGLMGVGLGSVAWGDYDNDGDLDILLTGAGAGYPFTPVSLVYRNDGPAAGSGWTFTDIGAGLPGVQDSSVAWGDYDDDGDLDILLTGYSLVSRVYRNDDCSPALALFLPLVLRNYVSGLDLMVHRLE